MNFMSLAVMLPNKRLIRSFNIKTYIHTYKKDKQSYGFQVLVVMSA